MDSRADLLIGKIALREGLLTQEQLYDCVMLQERSPSKPLGSIMVTRGYINEEQLKGLLHTQQSAMGGTQAESEASQGTLLLGKMLIEKGFASEYQVNECLRLQARMAELGITPVPHLGEILLKRGYIQRERLQTALMLQSSELYACPECGSPVAPAGIESGVESYTCNRCQTRLPTMFAKLAASLYQSLEKAAQRTETGLPAEVIDRMRDPSSHFGKYVLVSEIGRGGAGVVWKAWQRDLNKVVALKILSHQSQTAAGIETPYGDAEDIKRFYNEIRAAADLDHPNIVPTLDFGVEQNHFFYAMRYIEGRTADQLALGSRRPPLDLALTLIRDIALALAYAHRKGIFHRDVKPSNIMLDRGGKPWIMDFGLAKIVRMGDPAYVKGVVMGTPYYMPPEQASGDMEKVDAVSDVYSLGAVMYELVTGSCPYADKSPETVVKVLPSEPPRPPRELNAELSNSIVGILRRAMHRDKNRRYPSCEMLAQDLTRCLEGREPLHARSRRSLVDLVRSIFKK